MVIRRCRRLDDLGVAPQPLRRITLTADGLSDTITAVTGSPIYRQRAQHFSLLLADEDGAAAAASIIGAQPRPPLDHGGA